MRLPFWKNKKQLKKNFMLFYFQSLDYEKKKSKRIDLPNLIRFLFD